MVRVLRYDRPPEQRELTEEQLRKAYGDGKYLLPQNVYLCALPARLHSDLAQLNSAHGLPQLSSQISPAVVAFGAWLFAVRLADKSLAAQVGRLMELVPDGEWVEFVRSVAEDLSKPLVVVTPSPLVEILKETVPDALSQGWKSEYKDPLDVLGYLAKAVDGYMAEWTENTNHFAAWTMVLQSSGWGKSRSIQELSTRGFHVAYVSFLSRSATGIPGRSAVADVLLSDRGAAQDPRCISAWVFAILSQIEKASPQDWRALQLEKTFTDNVSERYKKLKGKVMSKVHGGAPRPGEKWESPELKDWISGKWFKLGFRNDKVIFCLDEAASLFKDAPGSFLAFRRFFSVLPRGMTLFGLVADTAGKLGMVFPMKMFDPSSRAVDPSAMSFEPLWVVGSSWRDVERLKSVMSRLPDLTAVSGEFVRELFKLGRPLWRALLDNKATIEEAAVYAMQKLAGGVSMVGKTLDGMQVDVNLITHAMATAVIGVAVGLEVVPWCDLAQDMVSSHMRSVTHVTGDRERVFTADVIEPILGEAAGLLLAQKQVLLQVLKLVSAVFKQGLVVEGPRGEVVGRLLLLLLAYHCCRLSKSGTSGARAGEEVYSHPLRLGLFLTELCGRKVEAEGLIFFNRFMFLNRRVITQDLLLSCFVCGFAIIPQRNQLAYDVLLPKLMPGPDGKYELRADRMRAVPVQIRNRQSRTFKTEKLAECLASCWAEEREEEEAERKRLRRTASTKRTLEFLSNQFREDRPAKQHRKVAEEPIKLGDPCGLYLHVRDTGGGNDQAGKTEVHITEDSKVLVLRGLRFPFLKEDVSSELEKMCTVRYTLELDSDRGKIVHNNFSNYVKLRKEEKDLLLNP